MAQGILGSIFGSGPTEVQIPAPPVKPRDKDPKPFDIEAAKRGQGKFPPQEQLFVNTARTSGHLTNIALAALIDSAGYTLQSVENLWNSADITDKSTYIVVTHGLLPPRDVLRYEYSTELLNTALPELKSGTGGVEVCAYVEHSQVFTVNVPQGFRVYVFCSGPTVAEGKQLPDALLYRTTVTLCVQRSSVGTGKGDNSADHSFTFTQRVALHGTGDLLATPPGVLRFVARAELVRL